jgi:Protein of unknown function (DUF3465)
MMALGEHRWWSPITKRPLFIAAILAVSVLGLLQAGCSTTTPPPGTVSESQDTSASTGDVILARAFAEQVSNLEVEGQGTVSRLLSDDTEGARHQRFIVILASGQTLLIIHNIDIAPRVGSLEVGDTVFFKGEYEWNEQGGLIHWTHHDPDGRHVPGWIKHNGRTYQ